MTFFSAHKRNYFFRLGVLVFGCSITLISQATWQKMFNRIFATGMTTGLVYGGHLILQNNKRWNALTPEQRVNIKSLIK